MFKKDKLDVFSYNYKSILINKNNLNCYYNFELLEAIKNSPTSMEFTCLLINKMVEIVESKKEISYVSKYKNNISNMLEIIAKDAYCKKNKQTEFKLHNSRELSYIIDYLDDKENMELYFSFRKHRYAYGKDASKYLYIIKAINLGFDFETLKDVSFGGFLLSEMNALNKELGLPLEKNTPIEKFIDYLQNNTHLTGKKWFNDVIKNNLNAILFFGEEFWSKGWFNSINAYNLNFIQIQNVLSAYNNYNSSSYIDAMISAKDYLYLNDLIGNEQYNTIFSIKENFYKYKFDFTNENDVEALKSILMLINQIENEDIKLNINSILYLLFQLDIQYIPQYVDLILNSKLEYKIFSMLLKPYQFYNFKLEYFINIEKIVLMSGLYIKNSRNLTFIELIPIIKKYDINSTVYFDKLKNILKICQKHNIRGNLYTEIMINYIIYSQFDFDFIYNNLSKLDIIISNINQQEYSDMSFDEMNIFLKEIDKKILS